jgi:hypothetical protein
MKKTITLLLFIIVLSLSSYAYTVELGEYHTSTSKISRNQFEIHKGDYSVCASDYRIIPIWIKNNNDYEESISLEYNGPNWAVLGGNGINLPVGKEGVIFIELKPDELGNYSTILKSKSQKAIADIPININVDECYSLNVNFQKGSESICGCEIKTLDLDIENTGKFDQDISLSFNGLTEYDTDNNSLNIKSGDKTTINVDINCPSEGNYDFEVNAKVSGMEFKDTIEVDVVSSYQCYKLDLSGKNKFTVYPSGANIQLSLKNIGLREQTYDFRIEGPEWVSTTTKTINLKEETSTKVDLSVQPSKEIDFGKYGMDIVFSTENNDYRKYIEINYKPENKIIKSVKDFVYYYRYYFYISPIIIILILILLVYLRRSFRKHQEKKEKRKLKKQAKLERKAKLEEKARLKEKEKKSINKKVEKSKPTKKKQDKSKFQSFIGVVYIIIVLLLLASLLTYYLNTKGLIKIPNIPIDSILESVQDFFVLYWNYMIIGLIFLVILIFVINIINKTITIKRN